jgi:hypothetical protein
MWLCPVGRAFGSSNVRIVGRANKSYGYTGTTSRRAPVSHQAFAILLIWVCPPTFARASTDKEILDRTIGPQSWADEKCPPTNKREDSPLIAPWS